MADLLSTFQLAQVRQALNDVVDTFYKVTVQYVHRVVTEDQYGENPIAQETVHTVRCKIDYSVGKGGRYDNLEESTIGQIEHPAWHVRFWKADLDAVGVVIDAENDTIRYLGKEYHFTFASEGGAFSDLGVLFYEVEIRYE